MPPSLRASRLQWSPTGSHKFFSNGIDLEWTFGPDAQATPETIRDFLASMMGLWARVLALPIPTVAAVNGHAFAGGAMFVLAHDHVLDSCSSPPARSASSSNELTDHLIWDM